MSVGDLPETVTVNKSDNQWYFPNSYVTNLHICFCGNLHLLWSDVTEVTVLSCRGRSCHIILMIWIFVIYSKEFGVLLWENTCYMCPRRLKNFCPGCVAAVNLILVFIKKKKQAGAPCLKINKETLPFVNDLTVRRVISSTVTKHCCETSWVIWAPACKLPDISTERTHSITGNCRCTIC